MMLSIEERARLDALVAALDLKASRSAPGMPGCREQPLSFAQLMAERSARLGGIPG